MDHRQRFDAKIQKLKSEQGKNVKMFSDLDYQLKIERFKEIRMPSHKWIPQDYALVTKFNVIGVEKDRQIHQRLVKVDKKVGSRKRYTTYKKLFEAIQEGDLEKPRLGTHFFRQFLTWTGGGENFQT